MPNEHESPPPSPPESPRVDDHNDGGGGAAGTRRRTYFGDRGGTNRRGGPGFDFEDFGRVIAEALRQTSQHQGRNAPSGTSSASLVEVRQKERVDVPVWSDDYLRGRSIGVALSIFKSAVQNWIENEQLTETMTGQPVPVGKEDVDLGLLKATYGEKKVRESMKIWTFMLSRITVESVQQLFLATQSPQAGYRVFLEHYSQKRSDERQRYDEEWNVLQQRQGESLVDYYARASAVWIRLRSYGDNRDEVSMCKHIARGFLPEHDRTKSVILFSPSLSSTFMQETLRSVQREEELERRSGLRKDGAGHALIATGAARGSGARGTAHGHGGAADGGQQQQQQRLPGTPPYQCEFHGPNSSHDTSNCNHLREIFSKNWRAFMEYMNLQGGAQGHVSAGGAQGQGRSNGGPPRMQQPQFAHGAGWIQERAQGIQRPQPMSNTPAPWQQQQPGHYSGGRGHGNPGPYPPEAHTRSGGGGRGAIFPPPNANGSQPPNLQRNHPANQANLAIGEGYSGFERQLEDGSRVDYSNSGWQAEHPYTGPLPPGMARDYGLMATNPAHAQDSGASHVGGGGFESANLPGDVRSSYISSAGPDAYQPYNLPVDLFGQNNAYGGEAATPNQQQQQLFGASPAAPHSSSPPPTSSGDAPPPPAGNGPFRLFTARHVCPRGKSDLSVNEELGRFYRCDNNEDSSIFPKCGVRLPGVPGVMVAHVKRMPLMHKALLSRTSMPSPQGSEEWHADSGASAFVTNDLTNMYDVQYLEPNEQYIQIGDAGLMRVVARGSLDLKFHQIGKDGQMEDVETCVPDVLFVPGCGFNIFSLWRVSHKHEVRINRHGTQLLEGRLRFIRGITGDSLFATRTAHSTTPTAAVCHASSVTWATLPSSATGGGSHGTTATSTGALPAPQQYASIQASSASPSPGTAAAYPRSQPPPSGSALLRAPGTVEANAAAAAPASSHGSTVTSAGALPAPQQYVPFQTAPVSSSPEAVAARHPSQPPPSGSALLRAPGTVEANAAAAASASPSPGAAAARPPSQPPPSGSALLWAPGTPDIEMGLLTQSGEEILPSVLDHRSATQDKPMFCPTSDQKGGIEQGGVQAGGYDQRVWTESVVESDTPPAAGASGEGIEKGDDWLFDALGVPCSGVHRGVPLGLFTGTA